MELYEIPEPSLICVSQVPAAAVLDPLMFHSTTIAPGVGPRVEKIISVISIVPLEPEVPTCTTGFGLVCDWKLLPVPIITGHASPVMMVSGGIVIVFVTR